MHYTFLRRLFSLKYFVDVNSFKTIFIEFVTNITVLCFGCEACDKLSTWGLDSYPCTEGKVLTPDRQGSPF